MFEIGKVDLMLNGKQKCEHDGKYDVKRLKKFRLGISKMFRSF